MSSVPDLWAVHPRIESLRKIALRPEFSGWRDRFLGDVNKKAQQTGAAPPGGRGGAEQAVEAAFAYLLTGSPTCFDRSVRCMEAVCSDPTPWKGGGPSASEKKATHQDLYPHDRADLITAETAKSCSTALSWLWTELDPDIRRKWVEMVAERGGMPIYESAMAGSWWSNALNSNWTSVLNSGLAFAALVLEPYDPSTASRWRAFARKRIVEMLDLAAEEAAGVEGPSYWLYCFFSAMDLVEALRNVHGDDLYGHTFWSKASRFLPYLTRPGMAGWVNYADTPYGSLKCSFFFHALASRQGDELAQWFGNRILEQQGDHGWRNVIFYDPEVPEQSIRSERPCRFFQSIHLASLRSGWDADAVFMLFKGGSNAWSHTHLDLNSFTIWAFGENLASDPGPEPYSIDYWRSIQPPVSTSWHNCIVVDGAHQRVSAQYAMSLDLEEAGDCYSRLGDWLCTDGIAMVRGDASTAYGDTLERAWRDVVYLPPDMFIICDDLLAWPVRGQRNFEWYLHSECPMYEVENGIEARGKRARLLIQPVFPEQWAHKFVEGRTIPTAGDKQLHALSLRPHWHHKWNEIPSRSPYPHWDPRGDAEPLFDRTCRFLTVLSPRPAGDEPHHSLEGFSDGDTRGVRIGRKEETSLVMFNHSGSAAEAAGITTDAEKAVLRINEKSIQWAVVRATELRWHGQLLWRGQSPTCRTGRTERR